MPDPAWRKAYSSSPRICGEGLSANAVEHGPAGGRVLAGCCLRGEGARLVCDGGDPGRPSLAGARGADLFSWRTSLTLVKRLGPTPAEAAVWLTGLESAVNAAIDPKRQP
jgi:hypothetical protein